MSILIFFLVLFVLILVHEWGHFIVAKKVGMRVDEFGIGFPPKLFGFKKGETEYTFNLLPIGGFVRILGENAEEGDNPADRDRSFVNKSKWAQAAVLVAGVTMNILFAWLLLIVVLSIGVPTQVSEEEATDAAKIIVTEVLPDAPAALAGIPRGSEIVSVETGGMVIDDVSPANLTELISQSNGEVVTLTVGDSVDPQAYEVTPVTGLIEAEPDRYAIGISSALVENVSMPIHLAILEASNRTIVLLGAITVGITNLITDSFALQADLSQVAGPVGIVGLVGEAAEFGITSLLVFTAVISLNLAVINMFPFPALDGGRLLFVVIEAIIRRPINPVWVGYTNFIGFALLILLMVAITYSDITKLL